MESVGYSRPPSRSLLLSRRPRRNRRLLGPILKWRSSTVLSPDVIQNSVLFAPAPATPVGTTTNAVAVGDLCAIAAASPAKSGDISVFLQTSVVLLGAYWVANFLVPDLISKYFGLDKIGKEDDENKPDEDNPMKEGRPSSQAKGRGFNSTRS